MGKSKKRKGGSVKLAARRVGVDAPAPAQKKAAAEEPKEQPARVTDRIQEKDSGLNVLKYVGIGIIVAILGAGALSRLMGTDDAERGDGQPGERCEATQECARGSRCFAYKEDAARCWVTCDRDKVCDPGYTCVSAAEGSGRKGTKIRAVCVSDDRVE